MLSHMELPADLAGYGEERLGKLEVGDLRSECARRGLDVKPQAQKNTCIKLLLEWKAAQGAPKQGLPFDLAHYGKERLEKLDVAVLRTECGLRGIDVKALAQTSTCVAELLKWKASRGGAPAPAKRKPKAEASGPKKKKKVKQEEPPHPREAAYARHEAALFGPNPGPRLYARSWRLEILVGEFNHEEPGITHLRLRDPFLCFDFEGFADEDQLQNLDSDVFADRSISIGHYTKKGSCPQLRSSPEAAVDAAKKLTRRLIKRDHEVLGFEDKAEVDNIKDGGYGGVGSFFGVENEITQGPGARGQMAATHYCNVNWKRTWRDEEGKECHASITVSIDIMRVVPEVLLVES